MKRRIPILLFALSMVVHFSASTQEFTGSVLRAAHDRLAPAMGLVEYTTEVINSRTGESSRRNSMTLGLVVSADGLVLTRGHMMLENNEIISVTIKLGKAGDEEKYDAKVLGKPDDVNIVFLQIESEEKLQLPYIRFASKSNIDLGQKIAIFGILNEELDYARALRETRISASLDTPRPTYCLDGSLPFGYICGPVINIKGEAIGIVGLDLSAAEGGEVYTRSGMPLVYQSELFAEYIKNPPTPDDEDSGEEDAYLGVFTQPLTDDLAEYWELEPTGGLVVSTVVAGSPAGKAGFEAGDVIKSFHGKPINAKLDREVNDFTRLVREVGVGEEVVVVVLRNGQPETLKVTLEKRPLAARDAEEYEDEVFGLTVRELTRDVRISLNLSEAVQGVIVSRIRSGSTAQLGRMVPGVIILEFGGIPVRSIEEFKAAIEKISEAKPTEVPVFARAGAATGFFRLEPRWSASE